MNSKLIVFELNYFLSNLKVTNKMTQMLRAKNIEYSQFRLYTFNKLTTSSYLLEELDAANLKKLQMGLLVKLCKSVMTTE